MSKLNFCRGIYIIGSEWFRWMQKLSNIDCILFQVYLKSWKIYSKMYKIQHKLIIPKLIDVSLI
jgi:hypothetical protein